MDEDLVVDGKKLGELRVVDLKKSLDKRHLSKAGNKAELTERLRQYLLEENAATPKSPSTPRSPKLVSPKSPKLSSPVLSPKADGNDMVQKYLAEQQKRMQEALLIKQKLQEEQQLKEDVTGSEEKVEEEAATENKVNKDQKSDTKEDMVTDDKQDCVEEVQELKEETKVTSPAKSRRRSSRRSNDPVATDSPRELTESEKVIPVKEDSISEPQSEKTSPPKNRKDVTENVESTEESIPESTKPKDVKAEAGDNVATNEYDAETLNRDGESKSPSTEVEAAASTDKQQEAGKSRSQTDPTLHTRTSTSAESEKEVNITTGKQPEPSDSKNTSEVCVSEGQEDTKIDSLHSEVGSKVELASDEVVEKSPAKQKKIEIRTDDKNTKLSDDNDQKMCDESEDQSQDVVLVKEKEAHESPSVSPERPHKTDGNPDSNSNKKTESSEPQEDDIKDKVDRIDTEQEGKASSKVEKKISSEFQDLRKGRAPQKGEGQSEVDNSKNEKDGGHEKKKRRWGAAASKAGVSSTISISSGSLKRLMPEVTTPLDDPMELDYEDADSDLDKSEDDSQKRTVVKGTDDSKKQEVEGGSDVSDGEIKDSDDEKQEEKVLVVRRTIKNKAAAAQSDDSLTVSTDSEQEPQQSKPVQKSNKQLRVINRRVEEPLQPLLAPEEPQRVRSRSPSPARRPKSRLIHIWNLTRPFTAPQLKELLNRYGSITDDGFWIDKIKTNALVMFTCTEDALKARDALHGTKWPSSNPKVLRVEFSQEDELEFHRGLENLPADQLRLRLAEARKAKRLQEEPGKPEPAGNTNQTEAKQADANRVDSRKVNTSRDRDRERNRRSDEAPRRVDERPRRSDKPDRPDRPGRRSRDAPVREWDKHKLRQSASPPPEETSHDQRNSQGDRRVSGETRDRKRRQEEPRVKDSKRKRHESPQAERQQKVEEPVVTLDDLFKKTTALPALYWLPLTIKQVEKRRAEREARAVERKQKQAEAAAQRDRDRKAREKRRRDSDRGRSDRGRRGSASREHRR